MSDIGRGSLGLRNDTMATLTCLEPFVTGYYEERRNMVVDAEDKSTFVYWWNLGKLLFSILP